ncbi:MAG: hypothetical protein L0Y72_03210 [Gemmataceae bacterium]|nr:hypothetical protein [Gemmataceae bacterium]MCI0738026.1 hypothetical protein [Gemmataceae bacterium]
MAGYIIYSLDWPKFRDMVERPTQQQLTLLARVLAEERENLDGEFEDADPILEWPSDPESLAPVVAKRLALPDWYGDLSRAGKQLWEGTVFSACMNCTKLGLDFRVDNDGVYWDVIEVGWKHLGVVPYTITDVALSAFGTRPFRYHQSPKPNKSRDEYDRDQDEKRASLGALGDVLGQFLSSAKEGQKDLSPEDLLAMLEGHEGIAPVYKDALKDFLSDDDSELDSEEDDDSGEWSPMHSMHTPAEVQRILAELKSIAPAMKATKTGDARQQYEDDLMPAIESIARDQRMLFIQVDT